MTIDLYDVDTVTAKELLRGFPPMTDAALADARERFWMAHHNNVIEGIGPIPSRPR